MKELIPIASSESEDDEEEKADESTLWKKKGKNTRFLRLWEKAKDIIFQSLSSTKPTFPYHKLNELLKDLKKALIEIQVESTKAFIWKHVFRWLMVMQRSFEGAADLKFDEKFNLLLIDFIVQFINYKSKTYLKNINDANVENIINEILNVLGIILGGNVSYIIMALLKIDIKDKSLAPLLYPIFNKYLADKALHRPYELVSYLRLVLCYRQWKKLVTTGVEEEKINCIAAGKSVEQQPLNSGITTDGVLPKNVPQIDSNNHSFTTICDLIGFARRNGNMGTRILLVNDALDVDIVIGKYFQQYERFINTCDTASLCDSTSQLNLASELSLPTVLLATMYIF